MALAVDSTSEGYDNSSGSSLTWAHTCTGSDRLLVVVISESRAITPTATYNGDAMTLAVSKTNGNSRSYIFYLINPDSGSAYNIVISLGATITYRQAAAVSFTGAHQTLVLGETNTKSGTAQNKTIDITTTSDDSVLIEGIGDLGSTMTTSSGQTQILPIAAPGVNRVGSYELVGNAGDYTQTWDATLSAGYAYVVAEFRDTAYTPTSIKSYNGVLKANIKSINGVAIADIKSINGLE